MILYESKNGKVEWLENDKIIIKTFSGYITGDDMKNAFNAGLEKMKASGGIKWLSDNRGLPTYKSEDIEWINNDWFPKMLKIGWKYWALVEPKSSVGQLVMDKFKFYTEHGIILQVFHTVEDALVWLKKQK